MVKIRIPLILKKLFILLRPSYRHLVDATL